MEFTTTSIKKLALPLGAKDKTFWDTLPAFGLRLRAGGSASWVVQYDVAGKTRRVTLGTPAMLAVAVARTKAKDLLASIRLGGDPAADKRAARAKAAETFGAILPRYLAVQRRECRPRSFKEIESRLSRLARSLHPELAQLLEPLLEQLQPAVRGERRGAPAAAADALRQLPGPGRGHRRLRCRVRGRQAGGRESSEPAGRCIRRIASARLSAAGQAVAHRNQQRSTRPRGAYSSIHCIRDHQADGGGPAARAAHQRAAGSAMGEACAGVQRGRGAAAAVVCAPAESDAHPAGRHGRQPCRIDRDERANDTRGSGGARVGAAGADALSPPAAAAGDVRAAGADARAPPAAATGHVRTGGANA